MRADEICLVIKVKFDRKTLTKICLFIRLSISMIVRICIVHSHDTNKIIHSWGLFMIPESTTLSEIFHGIRQMNFRVENHGNLQDYNDVEFQCYAAAKRTVPGNADMMQAHQQLKIGDLKDREALYLQFSVKKSELILSEEDNLSSQDVEAECSGSRHGH